MPEPLEVRPLLAVDAPAYRTHQVVPRVFSPAQCRRIIELADGLAVDSGDLVGADGATDVEQFRRSRLSWLPFDERSAWVYEKLAEVAERTNQMWRFDLTGFTEDLQVTRYDEPGAFYTWHQDGLDGEVAGRKLSMVVQLTDPTTYEGAELELLEVVEDYGDEQAAAWRTATRRQGAVVAFPAFEYHRVTPLVRGERRSLVCWVGGPPFR